MSYIVILMSFTAIFPSISYPGLHFTFLWLCSNEWYSQTVETIQHLQHEHCQLWFRGRSIYFEMKYSRSICCESNQKYKLNLGWLIYTVGSLRSTTRPARRRAFKTKKFGVSTNNSIICFIAMQTYKELTKKFVMQDKNCQ
jgi:hypothetical protein